MSDKFENIEIIKYALLILTGIFLFSVANMVYQNYNLIPSNSLFTFDEIEKDFPLKNLTTDKNDSIDIFPKMSSFEFYAQEQYMFINTIFSLTEVMVNRGQKINRLRKKNDHKPPFNYKRTEGQKVLLLFMNVDNTIRALGFDHLYNRGFNSIEETQYFRILQKIEGDVLMSTFNDAKKAMNFEDQAYKDIALNELRIEYLKASSSVFKKLEAYIKSNPDDFCTDHEKQSIPALYNGDIIEYYSNGNMKNKVQLINGILNGELNTYYPNGNIKSSVSYKEGKKIDFIKYYTEEGDEIEQKIKG